MCPIVLFDIDGTLVDTGGASGAAFSDGFRAEFDVANPAKLKLHGRTDRGIAKQLFSAHGIDNSESNFHKLTRAYLERLPQALASYPGRLLEGVVELLAELKHLDIEIALLTGNLRDAAFAKVNHFGIGQYFGWGFFGDHHDQRVDLGRYARAVLLGTAESVLVSQDCQTHPIMRPQANNRLQRVTETTLSQSTIIGDTPLDVQCANEMRVRSMAVCTGGFSRDELAEYQPDAIQNDLTDTTAVIESIMKGSINKGL